MGRAVWLPCKTRWIDKLRRYYRTSACCLISGPWHLTNRKFTCSAQFSEVIRSGQTSTCWSWRQHQLSVMPFKKPWNQFAPRFRSISRSFYIQNSKNWAATLGGKSMSWSAREARGTSYAPGTRLAPAVPNSEAGRLCRSTPSCLRDLSANQIACCRFRIMWMLDQVRHDEESLRVRQRAWHRRPHIG
jgi:hypothetical protein